MAVALAAEHLPEAVDCARTLLDPSQQKLADGLTAVLENAVTAWQQNQSQQARQSLVEAISLAQQTKFL